MTEFKKNLKCALVFLLLIGISLLVLFIACFIMQTAQIVWYLPILMISAVITGFFTGSAAQVTLKQLRKAGIIQMFSKEEPYA